ncbi:TrmB family transcriptional regulator [Spirochaeta africana]|uniref:Putative transcriptional regulator n=1 Tax=Spirochaeta africana (strain ATCC 700263 / DSM 8902 / Z-7692) TaxID=889378 RepID=H9UMI4_SPIAZ|nr:helix-turn-helix domain-containing protein [Spirochaeta africana]AFG38727.1 putative transcriptional regulator [Spirochaeta africana DSM 8902]
MSIIDELERFQFSRMEAQVYVCLVQHGRLNGSQIARQLHCSRSSVYSALNNLYSRGAVTMLTGEPTEYAAEDPDALFSLLQQQYTRALTRVRSELKQSMQGAAEQQYHNLRGSENCLQKARELISRSRSEVLLHTNLDINLLADAIRTTAEHGTRVVVFSFIPLQRSDLPIELYLDTKFGVDKTPDKRLLLVCDHRSALIAGGQPEGSFVGTFSGNPLLVSIIAEHIHHDVYLYKLSRQLGRNVVDPSIQLDSLLERNFKGWLDRAHEISDQR